MIEFEPLKSSHFLYNLQSLFFFKILHNFDKNLGKNMGAPYWIRISMHLAGHPASLPFLSNMEVTPMFSQTCSFPPNLCASTFTPGSLKRPSILHSYNFAKIAKFLHCLYIQVKYKFYDTGPFRNDSHLVVCKLCQHARSWVAPYLSDL